MAFQRPEAQQQGKRKEGAEMDDLRHSSLRCKAKVFICCNIEFVWTMLGLCCKMEVTLGPLDCSLPSLTDLLLTSAESWLVGAC